MKTSRRPPAWLLLLFLLTALTGCDKPETSVTESSNDPAGVITITPGEPVKIGVLQALSGKVANLGKEQIRGLELALDEREWQIAGHQVELVIEDTGCRAEGGANAALKLIAIPELTAIFGTTCSGAAATAAHAASQAGLTMISGNNNAPFLTSIAGKEAPDYHPGYFRTAANEENAGTAAALYAVEKLGKKRAALINDGDIYTRGLTESFKKAFAEAGGEVVFDTSLSKGEAEMGPFLDGALLAGAEILFFPLFQPEGNRLLKAARAMPAFSDIVLMSDGALIESSFITDVGEAAVGMYFVGPALPPTTPATKDLLERYKKKYRQAPSATYYMSGYDAANILLSALEKSATRDADGSIHIKRSSLRNTVAATQNFQGVMGLLSCDRFGDCAPPRFNLLRLDDPLAGLEGLQRNIVFSYAPQTTP